MEQELTLKKSGSVSILMKKFRAPFVCGVLLITGFVMLLYGEYRAGFRDHLVRERAFARGLHESCNLLVRELTSSGFEKDKLRAVFDILVDSARPLKSVVVFRASTIVAASKNSGPGFIPSSMTGERELDGTYFIWSPVESIGDGAILVTGLYFSGSPKSKSRHSSRFAWNFFISSIAIIGAMLLWALSIYTRELSAKLEQERTEKEHLNQLRLSAAGLAHETKNPLGIILGLAQRLTVSQEVSSEVKETACQIMDSAENASSRLGEFIEYARLREARIQPVQGKMIVERAVSILQPDFDDSGISITSETENISIACDEEMTLQVLLNLLLNSLHASQSGSFVTVELKKSGDGASLVISDTGNGISPEILPDVFQPYVSNRAEGHGLGLAIVKRVADSHGWSLHICSKEGTGTSVTISNIDVVSTIDGLSTDEGDE